MGLLNWVLILVTVSFLPLQYLRKYVKKRVTSQRRQRAMLLDQLGVGVENLRQTKLVGFFHPYW